MATRDPLDTFEQLAERLIASWGDGMGYHDLAVAVETLYRAKLALPASWPEHRRREIIARHADLAASELVALFDDLIDTVINDHGPRYGVVPNPDDRASLVDAARQAALSDFAAVAEYNLIDEIAAAMADDPGRGQGSMTACGPRQRRKRSCR